MMENACALPATSSQSQLFDIGIICNDVCYGAHKFILAMQSTYLKKLFIRTAKQTGNSTEACRIVMDDIEEVDVVNILKYCYDGEIGIPKEQVKGFLRAGKILQLDLILELIQEDEDFRDLESESFQEKFNTRVANINLSLNNDNGDNKNNNSDKKQQGEEEDKVKEQPGQKNMKMNSNNNLQNNMLILTKMEEMDQEGDDDVRIIDMVPGSTSATATNGGAGKLKERKHKFSRDHNSARVPLPKRPNPSIIINRTSDHSKTVITYAHPETGKLMEMKKKSPDARFSKIEGDGSSNDSFSQSSSFNQGTLAFSGINSFDDKSASNSNACWMLADTIDSIRRPSQNPLIH